MATVTELVTKFSFQGSTEPLSKFNKNLTGSITLLAGMTAGIVAVSGALSALIMQTMSGANAQQHLAKETGVAIGVIQELGFIASVSGSSAAALEGTIDSLSQTIGDAAQKGNEEFARLGISVRDSMGHIKTADTILAEVGQRFKDLGLSLQERKSFAQALGIDSSLVQMLGRTSAEMLTLKKKARDFGLVTKEQSKSIIDFNDSFTILRFGMESIKKQISVGLSPAIKELADGFVELLATNKDLIINGFKLFGETMAELMKALDRLKYVIAAIIALFVVWQVASIGLGTVLAAIFSPVVLITAGIVALLLIIDDLIVAMNGGKSVIRDFFLEFFGFDIVPIIQGFIDAFKLLGKIIVDTFKAAFSLVTGDFDGFLASMKNVFAGIADYVSFIFAPIMGIMDKVTGFLGFGGGDQSLSPGSSSSVTSLNNSVSQEVKIEIKTNDPLAAGEAVSDSLQSQLENANTQIRKGGR